MTLLLAFVIGFFAGLRSLTAPAATAWAVYLGWLKVERPLSLIGSLPAVAILTLLAVVELVADKLPRTPEPHGTARFDRAHRNGRVNRRVRCCQRSARNFSRHSARRRWRCRGLFSRLPGSNRARESAGHAGYLHRSSRGSRGDRRLPVGGVAILNDLHCEVR
jgi:Domain of unknown function (DUF4126)